MKIYRWIVASVALISLALSGCKKDPVSYEQPVYTDFTFPAEVSATFPATDKGESAKLPALTFHIDNRAMRIWNKTALPYQSQFDSINLTMKVTSEAVVRVLNEQTKEVTVFNPRKENRINATGGKLKISIETKDKPTINYDMRIMTYGYDPNKFTWTKESATLPIAAEQAKLFTSQGIRYWMARTTTGIGRLYIYDEATNAFAEVSDAKLPNSLLPTTLTQDSKGLFWIIDNTGALYKSKDLKHWTIHPTGTTILTQLIGETSKMDGSVIFSAIGHEGNTYATYIITEGGLTKGAVLPANFPVQEAFVYTYSFAGATSTTLYGGMTANGDSASKSYFLSGSHQWGETPYQSSKHNHPMSGGLYLRTALETELFLIGGTYPESGDTKTIKRSTNRGVTWTPLPDQELPDGAFKARHHASGYATGSGDQLQIHIFGGVIDNTPSREIWHGRLDTKGGIINSWEK